MQITHLCGLIPKTEENHKSVAKVFHCNVLSFPVKSADSLLCSAHQGNNRIQPKANGKIQLCLFCWIILCWKSAADKTRPCDTELTHVRDMNAVATPVLKILAARGDTAPRKKETLIPVCVLTCAS